MGQYRKKPVVIEAWTVKELNWAVQHNWGALPLSVQEASAEHRWIFGAWDHNKRGISIPTLEGVMFAGPDDWIIRGVQGEFYPCKADIFEATYDAVE